MRQKKPVNVLVVGIVGVVSVVLNFIGVPFVGWVGLVLGIAAIVEGNKAKRLNPADQNAKIGFILGIVAVALFVVNFILGIILAGVLISSGALQQ